MKKRKKKKNGKFFENNKSKLENFAKELRNKKYAHRDIEDIAKKARASCAIDLQNGKANEFDIKYLTDAVETKGKPVGAIEEGLPIWERLGLDAPDFENVEPEKTVSFWKRIFNFKSKK